MKRLIFMAIAVVLSFYSCNSNEPDSKSVISSIMNVEGKTFYEEGYSSANLSYIQFIGKYFIISRIGAGYTGEYVQEADVITMTIENPPYTLHAYVKGDMIVYDGHFYTQNYPNY